MSYNLELITWHWQNEKKEIQPIINLILYNGSQSPYPYKITIKDLLENNQITKELLFEGNHLIDLSLHEDSDIEQHKKTALMELLLKHGRQRDFYNFLENLKKNGKFKLLLEYYDKNYIEGILLFVADVLNSKNHREEDIIDLFIGISERIDKDMISVRQAMEHKYTQRGIQQGMQQGVLHTAKKLLKYGAPLDLVKKSTGLSKKEIEELKKK